MSNALAVAHVTQALALLIESNLRPEIDMAVSVETRKPPAEPPTEPTITVFLYQVTHNPSMRNHDLPTRASDGTLVNKPVAALDLHYVISAYGEENELVGQRLIGCVARVLREYPVLPADVIQEAGERPYLAASDLGESQQKVRFTPLQMDVDETSKLWGMLHQTPYSLSMTYQASLVLIEGREEPERVRPVERTAVTVGASGVDSGAGGAGSGGWGASGASGGSGPGAPGAPGAPGVSVVPTGRTDDRAAAGAAAGIVAGEAQEDGAAEAGASEKAPKKTAKKPERKDATKDATKGPSKDSGKKPAAKKASAKKAAGQKSASKRPSRGGSSGGDGSGRGAAEGTEG